MAMIKRNVGFFAVGRKIFVVETAPVVVEIEFFVVRS